MARGLPEYLQGLLSAEAYPHPVSTVLLIETHVSWVLLTGTHAYKIKRPVRFDFVDLTSPERRAFYCQEELRLNRRFAPELYVDVVPVRSQAGRATLRGDGEIIEHAVCMRQFDGSEELDRLLESGRIEDQELARFGASLASVHASLPVAAAAGPFGTPAKILAQLRENVRQSVEAGRIFSMSDEVEVLSPALLQLFERLVPLLESRLSTGFVRECHGDLHARNVVRLGGRLIAFDCMEFEPAFRWIDVAEEVAFLCADLRARGFRGAAQSFLRGYLEQSGDYPGLRLHPLYQVHRALVRAKVVALSAREEAATDRQRDTILFGSYIAVARDALGRKNPRLILMNGLSGSGKTWLAARLAPALEAVHLRSDVERKRLAGLEPTLRASASPGQGLYSQADTTRMYRHLAEQTQQILMAGYTVIVDATFERREQRARFRTLAAGCGVPLSVVRCQAAATTLRERIRIRAAEGKDPSDADVAVLEWQERHAEAIEPAEGLDVIDVQTTPPFRPAIDELILRLGGEMPRAPTAS